MYVITKEFAFSASHQLLGLPAGHPCGRLHGHNYRVLVELSGNDLSRERWLCDYGELDGFGLWLDEHLDHRDLNAACEAFTRGPYQTTAENLAALLFIVATEMLPEGARDMLSAVGVSETPKTWAWYRPAREETDAAG